MSRAWGLAFAAATVAGSASCVEAGVRNIMLGMEPVEEGYPTAAQLAAAGMKGGASKPVAVRDLPASFDGRNSWPGCIHAVMDQGQCGSCWAFAASETLSDRLCIASKGAVNVTLSPGDLLACEKLNLGCTCGSLPEWAWHYLQTDGIPTEECVPYTSGTGHTQKCPKDGLCPSGSSDTKRYFASNYTQCGSTISPAKHVEAIQTCLLDGPVDATFNVYADFDDNAGRGQVYKKGEHQAYEGLHSVKVVGWGVLDGTDYWTVQNSWGSSWGTEGGFFKIARGNNECGFEGLIYTGAPKLD